MLVDLTLQLKEDIHQQLPQHINQVQVSDVVFYIRNLDITIDSDMRILYNSKYYFVNGVKEIDGRERFLEIETKEKE